VACLGLEHTVDVLEASLEQHRWVALPAVSSENMMFYGGGEEGAGPPYSLMEHPPVAVYTNGATTRFLFDFCSTFRPVINILSFKKCFQQLILEAV
jgi:hypothetical protein